MEMHVIVASIRKLLKGCRAVINAVGQTQNESYIFEQQLNEAYFRSNEEFEIKDIL